MSGFLMRLGLALLAVLLSGSPALASRKSKPGPDEGNPMRTADAVGTWQVTTNWNSGPLAGNSGTTAIAFFPGGAVQVSTQPIESRDTWSGSYPYYNYTDYNINAPGTQERSFRTFAIDASGRFSTSCGATYYHGNGRVSSGACYLTRVYRLIGDWDVTISWTSGPLAGTQLVDLISYFDDGSMTASSHPYVESDHWFESFPNYTSRDNRDGVAADYPALVLIFTLDTSATNSTTCQASFRQQDYNNSDGMCVMRRR